MQLFLLLYTDISLMTNVTGQLQYKQLIVIPIKDLHCSYMYICMLNQITLYKINVCDYVKIIPVFFYFSH